MIAGNSAFLNVYMEIADLYAKVMPNLFKRNTRHATIYLKYNLSFCHIVK